MVASSLLMLLAGAIFSPPLPQPIIDTTIYVPNRALAVIMKHLTGCLVKVEMENSYPRILLLSV
jgi:hypothetical protein